MDLHEKIEKFVEKLSKHPNLSNVQNPYLDEKKRQNNLKIYLAKMGELKPNVLLIGEAPGPKGCAVTGIPFTSEYIMIKNPTKNQIFKDNRYKQLNNDHKLRKEATATIMWNALKGFEPPLLWNSFPFHPYKDHKLDSIRAPNETELKEGEIFINDILEMFPIKTILAVGRKAQRSLEKIKISKPNIKWKPIRHPSHGGKAKFVQQLNEAMKQIKKILKLTHF